MSPPSDSDTLDTPTALLIKASVVNAGGHLQGEMTSLAQPGGNFWGFRLCGDVWDLLCCRNAPPHTKQALSFQRHPALPCPAAAAVAAAAAAWFLDCTTRYQTRQKISSLHDWRPM